MAMKRYDLIHYFDVWKNECGDYEVNNQCVEFSDLHIDDAASDKEILEYLVSIGFLRTSDMRKIRIEDYAAGMLEIYAVKGYEPIAALIEKEA